MSAGVRVALVHDWLVGHRGGEQVLLALARLFPAAPIYTLVRGPASRLHPELAARRTVESFVARLPGAPARFRGYLPLFPAAVRGLPLAGFDLVVTTSHCVAHGVARAHPAQRIVCYVHSPMRYLYDQLPHYLPGGRRGALLRPLARLASAPLRAWDRAAGQRPDLLLANSATVATRIAAAWGRTATVLHPPVDVDYFAAAPSRPRVGYLAVGALVAYKRMDRVIDLANHRRLPLTVVGDGPLRAALGARAGPTVRLVPRLARPALRAAYAGARALLFAGVEDFGIAPVEAMAAGCPVLARAAGGLRETVVGSGAGATGAFFAGADVAAMAAGLDRLEAMRAAGLLQPATLLQHALTFDEGSFRRHFVAHLAPVSPPAAAAAARAAALAGDAAA